ncbi:MAG: acetyltransferase [Candidatus Aureabacteria bacterium]|nr:acetyltransferase [Candidatus Auribacterota bacterium]
MAKNKKLIIVGASAFGEVAYEYFTHDSDFKVVAFSAEKALIRREELFGLPVLPFEDLETRFHPSEHYVFVALVYNQMNRPRTRLYQMAKAKAFRIATYVSSKAFVWRNARIGENCFIFEDNTVQPFVTIGNNVILWSGNHIGHHSIIRDNCFISSHVVVSGFCDIGENCFLGVNSTIANNITVGKDCFLGAGALLQKSTEEGMVYQNKGTMPSTVGSLRFFKIRE